MDTIIIASRNPAKIQRYQTILAQVCQHVIGLNETLMEGKPAETGSSAEENAEIKARYYAARTGHIVFAEDEALYVDFLPDDRQPGVHVRRVGRIEDASDAQLLAHWERLIADAPPSARTGKWHTACCIACPDQRTKTIALDIPIRFFSPSSQVQIPGWPMSSLQGPLAFGKPHSELTEAEKRTAHASIDRIIAAMISEMLCNFALE